MAQLISFQLWRNAWADLLAKTNEGGVSDSESALCPLYDLDPEFCRDGDPSKGLVVNPATHEAIEKIRDNATRCTRLLGESKRFVVPDDFSLSTHLGHNPSEHAIPSEQARELLNNNLHLPFPTMFLQFAYNQLVVNPNIQKGHSWAEHIVILLHQLGGGWEAYYGLVRKHPDGKHSFDFVPDSLGFEVRENNVDTPMSYSKPWPCFTYKTPKEDMAKFFEVLFRTILGVLDVINNYPTETKISKGLRLIPCQKKLVKRDRIEHHIIRLGQAYYQRVGEEVLERERIRKRLHDVRGHWRILKNGRRTWVKSHQRGDENLGRVDSEYDVGT